MTDDLAPSADVYLDIARTATRAAGDFSETSAVVFSHRLSHRTVVDAAFAAGVDAERARIVAALREPEAIANDLNINVSAGWGYATGNIAAAIERGEL